MEQTVSDNEQLIIMQAKSRRGIGFQVYNLRLQIGASPDQSPYCWQYLDDDPTSKKPSSHWYVAVDPTCRPLTLTLPYDGADSFGQRTANNYAKNQRGKLDFRCINSRLQIGASPDQSPYCWQYLDDDPMSKKPSSHSYVAVDPTSSPLTVTLP